MSDTLNTTSSCIHQHNSTIANYDLTFKHLKNEDVESIYIEVFDNNFIEKFKCHIYCTFLEKYTVFIDNIADLYDVFKNPKVKKSMVKDILKTGYQLVYKLNVNVGFKIIEIPVILKKDSLTKLDVKDMKILQLNKQISILKSEMEPIINLNREKSHIQEYLYIISKLSKITLKILDKVSETNDNSSSLTNNFHLYYNNLMAFKINNICDRVQDSNPNNLFTDVVDMYRCKNFNKKYNNSTIEGVLNDIFENYRYEMLSTCVCELFYSTQHKELKDVFDDDGGESYKYLLPMYLYRNKGIKYINMKLSYLEVNESFRISYKPFWYRVSNNLDSKDYIYHHDVGTFDKGCGDNRFVDQYNYDKQNKNFSQKNYNECDKHIKEMDYMRLATNLRNSIPLLDIKNILKFIPVFNKCQVK